MNRDKETINRLKVDGADIYKSLYGMQPDVELLPGAGSDRKYSRLSAEGGPSVILTEGDDIMENKAFVGLAKVFRSRGLNVPEILAESEDCSCYLQEDLGDCQLLPLLSTVHRIPLAVKTLESLALLQTVDEKEWGPYVRSCPFSQRLIMWDLNYFKYCFLKPSGIPFDEERLQDDLEALARRLMSTDHRSWGFMYRDCQSRNVMIRDGEPWWIDFQGGRKGPLIYDAVSFLWQAKAGFSKDERQGLLKVYAGRLSDIIGVPPGDIVAQSEVFALFRTFQVLGAYGFRGMIEKKAHFIESIPAALRNLKDLLDGGALARYPELGKIAEMISCGALAKSEESDGLTVKVFSFSYKKGYPEDLTGNGGGFMFDCRGMHNPGRYDQYKPLTGLDRPVRDFLEERGEVQAFVSKAFDIVSPVVARYRERGFRSLQVGFGCTGGRHRSVYCAQAFAEKVLREYPGLKVRLEHREQNIIEKYN